MSLTRPVLSSNALRWIVALGLGFLAGALTVIADNTTWPGFYPLLRGGVIDMLPTAVALKMTLGPKMSGGPTGTKQGPTR